MRDASGGTWDGTWRNTGCRLTVDMTLAEYRAVVLENRWLRVTLLADKGGDVIEFLYKPLDVDAMFRRPGGLRHPSRWIPSNASAHGHFFDSYAGGWQLIFPAAGPPSGYAGAEFGQHGEACLLPFAVDVEEDDPRAVAVTLRARMLRTPFLVERHFRLGEGPELEVEERITNLAPVPLPFVLGEHPALGGGLLGPSSRLELAGGTVLVPEAEIFPEQRLAPGTRARWPLVPGRQGGEVDLSVMPGPEARTADYFYITELPRGWYRVTTPDRRLGLEVVWDLAALPVLWFWQVAGGVPGWPWWGQVYVQALEPFSAVAGAIDDAMAAGQVRLLPAGGQARFQLAMRWCEV